MWSRSKNCYTFNSYLVNKYVGYSHKCTTQPKKSHQTIHSPLVNSSVKKSCKVAALIP
jgi:hypothetical protein